LTAARIRQFGIAAPRLADSIAGFDRRSCRAPAARKHALPDTTDAGGPAGSRIDLADRRAVQRWCRTLDVTPAELRFLVDSVGPLADDVKLELAAIAIAPWLAGRPGRRRGPGG